MRNEKLDALLYVIRGGDSDDQIGFPKRSNSADFSSSATTTIYNITNPSISNIMSFGDSMLGADEGKIISRLLSYIHSENNIVNINLRAGTTLANVTGEINGQQCIGVIQIFNEILKKSANYHSLLGRSLAQKYLVRQWTDYGVRYVVGNRFQSPIVLKDIEMALSKTYFIAGDFVTLCDLIIFYGLYAHVSAMEECEKDKYNNTCHWFSFLQKDSDLIQNLKKITFQKNVCEAPGESYFSKRKYYPDGIQ